MASKCFFCKRSSYELEDIRYCTMNTSKKSAKSVLLHLGNLIKTKLIFQTNASICKICINELKSYDDLMVKLLDKQKKLTHQLQQTLFSGKQELNEGETVADEVGGAVKEEPISIEDMLMEGLGKDTATEITTSNANVSERNVESPIFQDAFMSDDSVDSWESLENDSQSASSGTKSRARPPQQCQECGQTFKSKRTLQDHISIMHNAKLFECSICNVTRKSQDLLDLHMNIHAGKTELECRYCDKAFTRSVNTLRHMRKHWNRLEYQCEKCGQLFAQDCLLYNHRQVHEAEENPLICEHCNQKFKSRKTYKHHLMTHSTERRRYACPRCPKSFTERYTLKMHMQVHGETLPYLKGRRKQNQVEEGLGKDEADNLSVSAENVDKELMDYVCTICETRLASRNQLNKHLESVHDVIIT